MKHTNLVMLTLLAALASNPALAGARDDVMAGISRCNSIADDRAFLDCVYGAAQPLRAQLGLPPAPAAQIRMVPPAMTAAVARPGVTVAAPPPRPRPGLLGRVFGTSGPQLHIASYSFDRHGMFTITLSDGEVLRQLDNDIHYAHWHGAPPKDAVTVTESTFGNATLIMDGENDPYLVRRVR